MKLELSRWKKTTTRFLCITLVSEVLMGRDSESWFAKPRDSGPLPNRERPKAHAGIEVETNGEVPEEEPASVCTLETVVATDVFPVSNPF